jgi:hypothetical protein
MNTFAVPIVQRSTFFRTKNPCENAENAYLQTYCSPNSDKTTADFPQVPCNFRPCYILESWLLLAANHSTPSSSYHWECGQQFHSEKPVDMWTDENIPFDFCNTDSWEFLSEIPKRSIALTKLFISPSLMCRAESKILLNSTSGGCWTLLFWMSWRTVPQFVFYSLNAISD